MVTLMLFSSCTHHAPSNYAASTSSLWGNDPKGAEVIYRQAMVKPNDESFKTIHQKYKDGSEVRQYDDRSINIEEQTFWDFTEEPKWYVN